MKRVNNLIIILILSFLMGFLSSSRADEHSESEVRSIIKKVQKKISELKKAGAERYANYEFFRIEDHIRSSKDFLDKGEEDQAYFEIRIGVEYFKLIEARKNYNDSKEKYEKTRNELSDK